MHFPLIHTGRRFFFFTFVVEDRRPVLSRLVRGAKRPELLPAGERIVALWRRLHAMEPHFTASDFVVMPDHVHQLLIVNSAEEFRFNPLVFAHWFMRATGAQPPNPLATPADWWHYYCGTTPGSDLSSSRGFGGGTTPGSTPGSSQGFGGGQPPSFVPWSPDIWVDITFDSRQLAAVRRYIRMNPARYFWKLDNPDMFRFRANLRHPVLDPALTWSAIGDITILASPFLYLVRLTMRKTAADIPPFTITRHGCLAMNDRIAAMLQRMTDPTGQTAHK